MVVIVAYVLPLGAAKLAAVLYAHSCHHTPLWARGHLSQKSTVGAGAHKRQMWLNYGVCSSWGDWCMMPWRHIQCLRQL